jgi:hypothetical protein
MGSNNIRHGPRCDCRGHGIVSKMAKLHAGSANGCLMAPTLLSLTLTYRIGA